MIRNIHASGPNPACVAIALRRLSKARPLESYTFPRNRPAPGRFGSVAFVLSVKRVVTDEREVCDVEAVADEYGDVPLDDDTFEDD